MSRMATMIKYHGVKFNVDNVFSLLEHGERGNPVQDDVGCASLQLKKPPNDIPLQYLGVGLFLLPREYDDELKFPVM